MAAAVTEVRAVPARGRAVSVRTMLGGVLRLVEVFAFAVVPAGTFLGVMVSAAAGRANSYGLEFGGDLWRPARRILDGLSPYEPHRLDLLAAEAQHGGHGQAVANLAQAVYPAATHVAAVPFALLPFEVAMALFAALSLIAVIGGLWMLGVRDWRCYGVIFMSFEAIQAIKLGGVTPFLFLALASLWQYRDHVGRSAAAAAFAVAAKLFLWPAALWLFATNRRVAAWQGIAAAVGVTVTGWALIGFKGMRDYPHLLSTLAALEQHHGESLLAIAVRSGLDPTTGRVLAAAVGTTLLAAMVGCGRKGKDLQAFSLALAAAFTFTPIVWTQYYLFVFVPIAIMRPRLTPMWAIPLTVWLVPRNGDVLATQLCHQAVLAATVAASFLPPLSWRRLLAPVAART